MVAGIKILAPKRMKKRRNQEKLKTQIPEEEESELESVEFSPASACSDGISLAVKIARQRKTEASGWG